MQTVLEVNLVVMSIKLFIVFSLSARGKYFFFCTHCKMTTMNHSSNPVKKATKRRRNTKCEEPTGSYPRTHLRKTSNNMQTTKTDMYKFIHGKKRNMSNLDPHHGIAYVPVR